MPFLAQPFFIFPLVLVAHSTPPIPLLLRLLGLRHRPRTMVRRLLLLGPLRRVSRRQPRSMELRFSQPRTRTLQRRLLLLAQLCRQPRPYPLMLRLSSMLGAMSFLARQARLPALRACLVMRLP